MNALLPRWARTRRVIRRDPASVAAVLSAAADDVQARGFDPGRVPWPAGAEHPPTPWEALCVAALDVGPADADAVMDACYDQLRRHLGEDPLVWTLARDRTRDSVVAALRATAAGVGR